LSRRSASAGLIASSSGTGRGRRPNSNRDGPWQVTFLEIYEKG